MRAILDGRRAGGALLAALVVLGVAMLAPTGATAQWSEYCNNVTLGNGQGCTGATRVLQGEFGWGDQHSVCVAAGPTGWKCSAGPGSGVYNPVLVEPGVQGYIYSVPKIKNNAAGSNLVHGAADVP